MGELTYTHRRDVWLAGAAWQQPARFDWGRLDYIVVHYPGCDCAPDGDIVRGALEPSDIDNLAAFIRRNHLSYLNSPTRGYNLGYSIGFDWLGGTWEIRGDEYRCAANAPAAFNARAIAFYVITDIDGAMTDLAVAAVADMASQVRRRRPQVRLIPHGDGPLYFDGATRTACPSTAIRNRITEGDFDSPTPPPPPSTLEDDDMALIATDSGGTNYVLPFDLSHKLWVWPGTADALFETGRYERVHLDDKELARIEDARSAGDSTVTSG